MVYVTALIAPVKKGGETQFVKSVRASGEICIRNGALADVQAWSDDVPVGKVNDLHQAVKREDDEDIVFSYIIWPDKQTCQDGMSALMSDPIISDPDFAPPMDGKRLIYGSFEPIVSEGNTSGADYIDGFLFVVPAENKTAYQQMAAEAWPFFEKFGAISMYECWGDDVPDGKLTSMPLATHKKPDEVVLFSWIGWPDKATRDKGYADMQNDPEFCGYGFF